MTGLPLRGYQREWLRGDLSAGVTVWAVLVPEALAYATIAGVSPVVGLYAAPAALIAYAVLGSSRHLIVAPMSATAALSAAAVAQFAGAGSGEFVTLTVTLALATGFAGVLAGLLRFGFVANFISEPVLKGFIIGLALTIIAGQLPALFGIESGSGNFFEKMRSIVQNMSDANPWTLGLGLTSLAIVVLCRERAPRLPGSLLAVLFGIAAIRLFALTDHGVAIVGPIDGGLPHVGLPSGFSASALLNMLPSAVGILLVAFVEGLGAAKNYAEREHYDIDPNRELLGLGVANVAAGLCSGMVVNGSLSKTAVNGGAGAKTQLSGLIVAALTLVTLVFFTGAFEDLPETTLAAVVIAAVVELVDPKGLRRLYRASVSRRFVTAWPVARADFVAAVAALSGVLIFDTLPGLFIGIATSMVLLLFRVCTPRIAVLGRVPETGHYADVSQLSSSQETAGVLVLRPEAGIFFANSDHISREVRRLAAEREPQAIILEIGTVPFVDVTGAGMLLELGETLERGGVQLVLAGSTGQVRDIVRRTEAQGGGGAAATVYYPTVEAALAAVAVSQGGTDSRPSPDPPRRTNGGHPQERA